MSDKVESIERAGDAETSDDRGATARQKLRDVKDDLSKRIENVSQEVRREAGRASDYAKERYGVARESLRQGYDRARKDFDQLSADVNAYVRDNPGRSVLIAAGLGFVIGMLLRSDRRSR